MSHLSGGGHLIGDYFDGPVVPNGSHDVFDVFRCRNHIMNALFKKLRGYLWHAHWAVEACYKEIQNTVGYSQGQARNGLLRAFRRDDTRDNAGGGNAGTI